VSRVVPVAKISDLFEPKDLRPVSILPALSKAHEIVMRDHIVVNIESVRALNPFQSGFRSGHSTVNALLNILDDIYRLLDQRFISLVLFDFSKAFDTVDHALLCLKLGRIYGFSGPAVSLIESYLSGRFQCVCAGGVLSGYELVLSGGFIKGPFLFYSHLLTISVRQFEHPITICRRMMCNYIRAIDTKICCNVLRDSMRTWLPHNVGRWKITGCSAMQKNRQ
jgi:hypothetical protein